MEYKLIAVDMDGTLLTPQLEISKDTIETINKVIEKVSSSPYQQEECILLLFPLQICLI